MLWAATSGAIEIRAEGGATRLRASFPYNAETTLTEGRAEVFAPGAFRGRIAEDALLLYGHDFDRPLASRAAGSLDLTDDDAGLHLVARVDGATSWARDVLAAHAAGLVRGISPGFTVPPGGDRVERRGAGLLRTVTTAHLIEISIVTRPAYPTAQVEARGWQATPARDGVARTLARWRA
jgi:HK97 family phage prohead protease